MQGGVNGTSKVKGKDQMSDQKVLEFYNLASGRLLTGLEVSTSYEEYDV